MNVKYLIIGAGPTGLGAAYQLSKLNVKDYLVLEKESAPGGLCRTFKKGDFYFDNCTHIVFTNRERVKNLLKDIGCEMTAYSRSAWVHAYDKLLHFPFQTAVADFPDDKKIEVIMDIARQHFTLHSKELPSNYLQYLYNNFGRVLCKDFMIPYNEKIWKTKLDQISLSWVKAKMPPLDLKMLLEGLFKPVKPWGLHSNLSYPNKNGFGDIINNLYNSIEDANSHFKFNTNIVAIDSKNKTVILSDNSNIKYEYLISTMPINRLLDIVGLKYSPHEYRYSKVVTTAVGFKVPSTDSFGEYKKKADWFQWCYFGDEDVPFFRLFNVSSVMKQPDPDYRTFLFDHTYTMDQVFSEEYLNDLVTEDIRLATKKGFMDVEDVILETQTKVSEYGYPVPTLQRDEALKRDHYLLEAMDIYSRGRFGGWRYEVGNFDHSILQGIEIIERLALDKPEETIHCTE